jgi:hypothetical protein
MISSSHEAAILQDVKATISAELLPLPIYVTLLLLLKVSSYYFIYAFIKLILLLVRDTFTKEIIK